jgi:hypothetical protein
MAFSPISVVAFMIRNAAPSMLFFVHQNRFSVRLSPLFWRQMEHTKVNCIVIVFIIGLAAFFVYLAQHLTE